MTHLLKPLKSIVLSLSLGLVAPMAQAAPGFLYDCTLSGTKQGRGWISPTVALVFPGDGSVKVVDAVTLHFNNGPVAGTILRDNAKRLVVKWTVKGAKADSGRSFANFDYRASISKSSGKMELTAIPREFDAGVRSAGKCAKRNK
jgi:hypothetical protein